MIGGGPSERRGHAQRLGQLVVPPVEWAVVLVPHLQADLERLLQPLETFADRDHGHSQPE
jgi:hypothetical protein